MVAVVSAVGAFNVLIDPLGVFGTPRVSGLNAIKPYLDHHRELIRWRSARRLCTNVAIFGNSRAEIGLDPESPLLAARSLSAFNHAIPGTGADTIYRQIGWLKAAGCMPKVIILGVDFFDFLGGSERRFPLMAKPDVGPGLDSHFFAESVFSLTGLRDSFRTIFLQRAHHPATLTDRGFNPLYNYISEVEQSGHYVLFRQRAYENARKWLLKAKQIRPVGGGLSEEEAGVDAILASAADADSTVYVIIYPYHAEIRVMLERLGLGELFSEWKRTILAIVNRHASQRGRMEVWDFSGIAPETLEAIPAPGDRTTYLTYYWEAGHFKSALGDRVIARILGKEDDFGILLNSANINGWLEKDRASVKALLAARLPIVAEVDDILVHLAKP